MLSLKLDTSISTRRNYKSPRLNSLQRTTVELSVIQEKEVVDPLLTKHVVYQQFQAFTRQGLAGQSLRQFQQSRKTLGERLEKAAWHDAQLEGWAIRERVSDITKLIAQAKITYSGPDLSLIGKQLEQLRRNCESSFYLHLQSTYLVAFFRIQAGEFDRAQELILGLLKLFAKTNLLELALLCHRLKYRAQRMQGNARAMLSSLESILKISWELRCEETEIEVYGDLSLAFYYLGQQSFAEFFKLLYERGESVLVPQFRRIMESQLRTDLLVLKEGLDVETEDMDYELMISEYSKSRSLEDCRPSMNAFQHFRWRTNTKRANLKDKLSLLVSGPVRVVRDKKEFRIGQLKEIRDRKALASKKLFLCAERERPVMVLSHRSLNKNFGMHFGLRREQPVWDLKQPEVSWRLIVQFLNAVGREAQRC